MNLPNSLTLVRMFLVPLLVAVVGRDLDEDLALTVETGRDGILEAGPFGPTAADRDEQHTARGERDGSANEPGHNTPGLLAEGAFDRARGRHIPGISITGRTSMAPWRAAGIRAACCVAVSRSGQSSR